MTASTVPTASTAEVDPTAAEAAPDIAHLIARNIAIGVAIMFSIVFAGGLIDGLEPLVALGVAVLPGLVAGPFIGGMLTVAAFRDIGDDHAAADRSGQTPT